MPKIHLDTDIGGDMDDVCALAMLLKWPVLDMTVDLDGVPAGYAAMDARSAIKVMMLPLKPAFCFHYQTMNSNHPPKRRPLWHRQIFALPCRAPTNSRSP